MDSVSAQANRKYRPDVDGLRAIAIISVVAYHAGIPGFGGGFVGVDVFFVISGFLITALLFSEAARSGRVNLGAFYARRVRRLMPAGFVVVGVTLLLGAFVFAPASDGQFSLARSAVAYAYFGSNFFFYKATGSYFDAPAHSMPLLHTWSLAVEEQYYLVWPLVILVVTRYLAAGRSDSALRTRTLWMLGAMFAASLALSVAATPVSQKFAFYMLPARVWEFAIGGALGIAAPGFFRRLRRWGGILALSGLGLIVGSVGFLDATVAFPGWAATAPVLGSAFLLAGMTADEGCQVRRLLASKPLVFVGLLSYSWYLWHWPLLSTFRIYNLGFQSVGANVAIVLAALALAWITYVLVENPIRVRRPGPFRGVRTTLLMGLGIALATVAAGTALREWAQFQREMDAYRPLLLARWDLPSNWARCLFGVTREFETLPRHECVEGPAGQDPKIILWGDSHAATLIPMLTRAFPDATVYQLTMGGCPPVLGYEAQLPGVPKSCREFNRLVMQEIVDLAKKGLEGVVVSARWNMHLRRRSLALSEVQPNAVDDPRTLAELRAEMAARFDETLGMLERAGVRVLVIASNPEFIYPPQQCLGLRRGALCDAPRAANEALLGDGTALLAEAVRRHPNARLAELMDFFCDEQTCYAARGDKIRFIDENHINATAAKDLAGFLRSDLDWLTAGRQGNVRQR